MQIEKAIERMKSYKKIHSDDYFDLAIEALEKQKQGCEGCIRYGKYENEIEYGYPSPCTFCKRRAEDRYTT